MIVFLFDVLNMNIRLVKQSTLFPFDDKIFFEKNIEENHEKRCNYKI